MKLLVESSDDLPLVDLAIKIRGGALGDPAGKEGLTRVMARLLRRGTRTMSSEAVDAEIARLGARLSITISREIVGVHASVLARNVEPLVALVAELLFEPAFRNADLARAKRRIRANLISLRDDDHALASRHLNAFLFGDHPYGRPTGGTHASVGRIRRGDLQARHQELWTKGNVLFGAAGAIDDHELGRLVRTYFGAATGRRSRKPRLGVPKMERGRRLLIVDKPGRTQTQLGVATLGVKLSDPLYVPMLVADSAFGGMFTSRLMQEVRATRGWSYSAYSTLGASRQRDAWRMWTHPSVDNARDCLALQLELLEQWVEQGSSADEIRRAKKYLRGARCFDEDTAYRRLDVRMNAALYGLGEEHQDGFRKAIGAVTRAAARDAVQRRIRARDVAIVAVGDAKRLRTELELPGIAEVRVVKYDAKL